MLFEKLTDTIGNTPLVQLHHLPKASANIYVKIESRNPSGSIKDRAVKYILEDLLSKGILKTGGTIVEPTSGNTGIGLAMAGAALGIHVIIVMPASMSVERRQLMQAYGAQIELTGEGGMAAAVKRAEELSEELNIPVFGQFQNKANVKAHYEGTGPEIYRDLPDVSAFVAGVGTGGTVTGVGKFLKEKNKAIQVIAVEPEESPLLSKGEAGAHRIQGIGANFVPDIFDPTVIDRYLTVSNDAAFEEARRLAKEHGILAGISSGANVVAARKVALKLGNGANVVTVLPDTGERYLSMQLFEGM